MKRLLPLIVLLAACAPSPSGAAVHEVISTEVVQSPATDNSIPASGYLWWPQSPKTSVLVMSERYLIVSGVMTPVYTEDLIRVGSACLAKPGSQYKRDDGVGHPRGTYALVVLSGNCNGYRGWIEDEGAFQDAPPQKERPTTEGLNQ